MITTPPSPDPSGKPKAVKRSVLGMLFNPQLGPAISPLRESTRIFLQLVASVFASYRLIPKDYPGLRDPNAKLTLSGILGTAWNNLSFTREGLPQTLLFFAITGMMAFSALAGASALLSIFIGHAHAQGIPVGSSLFLPESQDIAQSWIDYLFNSESTNSAYPSVPISFPNGASSTMANPFNGSISLQSALTTALATYSDAILIIAAIVLFYHLAAMVVETAHHGTPMGKRASQIWAPIRLVVAIGLLVPVNGGLSSGQFIVVKMAAMGSGLASHTWDVFLNQFAKQNANFAPPPAPDVQQAGLDVIYMEACRAAWNAHIGQSSAIPGISDTVIQEVTPAVGQSVLYSSNAAQDSGVCGVITIASPGSDQFSQKAAAIEAQALNQSLTQFENAAQEILPLMDSTGTSSPSPESQIAFNQTIVQAVEAYENTLNQAFQTQLASTQNLQQMQSVVSTIEPLGWVMAGAFLNTIARMQGMISAASSASIPKTTLPYLLPDGSDEGSIRNSVARDMANFDIYLKKTMQKYSTSASGVACAGMFGLKAQQDGGSLLENLFVGLNVSAQLFGSWTVAPDTSSPCGSSALSQDQQNLNTVSLGIQFGPGASPNGSTTSTDPFTQMIALGHSNIAMAVSLLDWAIVANTISGATTRPDPDVVYLRNQLKAHTNALFGGLQDGVSTASGGISTLLSFLSLVFWAMGFTLAFLLPLMPFMRFLFAVLTWIAALIEAVIAIPLVALAHLNPESEGLSGQQAKAAYFFIFNLFLRPVLMIFGLVAALIIFLIAVSFLNYGYAIAIADSGGTAYGYVFVTRLVYSVLYVAILYVCANHAFQLIDHLPATAMSWLGAQAQKMPEMGNTDKIESIAGLISTYGAQQGIPAATGAGKAAGQAGRQIVNTFVKSNQIKNDAKNKDASKAEFGSSTKGPATGAILGPGKTGGAGAASPTEGTDGDGI